MIPVGQLTIGLKQWTKFYSFYSLDNSAASDQAFFPPLFFFFFLLKKQFLWGPVFSSLPSLYILTLKILSSKIEYIFHVCIQSAHFQTT